MWTELLEIPINVHSICDFASYDKKSRSLTGHFELYVNPKVRMLRLMYQFRCPQASDFTDIGDWPSLGRGPGGVRCHSTPPPHDGDSSHHNGNSVSIWSYEQQFLRGTERLCETLGSGIVDNERGKIIRSAEWHHRRTQAAANAGGGMRITRVFWKSRCIRIQHWDKMAGNLVKSQGFCKET